MLDGFYWPYFGGIIDKTTNIGEQENETPNGLLAVYISRGKYVTNLRR